MLTSVHRDCGPQIDWRGIAAAPPPPPPAPVTTRTRQAEQDRDNYRPGLLARMFGGATKRRASLAAEVEPAREQDQRETKAAHQQHLGQCEEVAAARDLARFVLDGDVSAYAVALEELDVFEELREVGVEIGVNVPSSDVVCLQLLAHERQVVPDEQETLTARGKLSSKKMPKTRGNEIYQDYICGAALRACRETFAALPAQWVVVTVRTDLLDPGTGHIQPTCVLTIVTPRQTLEGLRFETLDPSEAMANFLCRMKFKKGSGMASVEEFTEKDVPRGAAVARP